MNPRTLLLAFLASPFFFPVSCTTAALPAGHALSWADGRDLAAGESPHLPLRVPLAMRGDAADVRAVDARDVPALLAADRRLTPRLPATGAIFTKDARLVWRQRGDAGAGQLLELQQVSEDYTQTTRYRATDTGIVPLSSRVYGVGHFFQGAAIAAVFAGLVQAGLRRRLLPRARAPAESMTGAQLAQLSGQLHTQCLLALFWLGGASLFALVQSTYAARVDQGGDGGGWLLWPLVGAGLWHAAIAWRLHRGRATPVVHRFAPEFALLVLVFLVNLVFLLGG